jgi:hypothetical protein
MRNQHVNRVSSIMLIVLSFTALLMVLIGLTQPPQPFPADEGALARVFQLSIAALVPVTLLFLATTDWVQPVRVARYLAVPATATVLAFGLLYYLEHVR